MTYNFEEIGKRIRNERKSLPNGKKKGISQGELAARLNYAYDYRQIVAEWETGAKVPSLGDALKLCNIFDCELGYLLCEPGYTCKNGRKTDIQKETRLSETAIDTLINIGKYGPTATHKALNLILENEMTWKFLAGQSTTEKIEGINIIWSIAQYLFAEEDPNMFMVRMDANSGYPIRKTEISSENYITHGTPLKALIDRANIETINDSLKQLRKDIQNRDKTETAIKKQAKSNDDKL